MLNHNKFFLVLIFSRLFKLLGRQSVVQNGKESACNARDLGLIPELGRSPGEGNGIHSSILAWRIPWTEEPTVHGVTELDMTE